MYVGEYFFYTACERRAKNKDLETNSQALRKKPIDEIRHERLRSLSGT